MHPEGSVWEVIALILLGSVWEVIALILLLPKQERTFKILTTYSKTLFNFIKLIFVVLPCSSKIFREHR
jgi:hypothetical protein